LNGSPKQDYCIFHFCCGIPSDLLKEKYVS
jgi:hypothetical protein